MDIALMSDIKESPFVVLCRVKCAYLNFMTTITMMMTINMKRIPPTTPPTIAPETIYMDNALYMYTSVHEQNVITREILENICEK
jgi:hypothetical protein